MEEIKSILKGRNYYVNVDNNINNINNVNVVDIVSRIEEATDKPRAIGEELVSQLNAPGNLRFYIKLAYQYPQYILWECLALTKEAKRDGKIKTTEPQYFYGILKIKTHQRR